MKRNLISNKLIVKKSPTHGYGVFAGKGYKKGEVIEECYIILTKGKDLALEDYYFDAKGKDAILTGYGMIYNHSENDNVDYFVNPKRRITTFKTLRAIKKGEELFISYGEEWFSSRGKKPKFSTRQKTKKPKKSKK